MPYYNRDPKRVHNFDNHPYIHAVIYSGKENGNYYSQLCRDDIGIMEKKMDTTI